MKPPTVTHNCLWWISWS